MEVYEHEIVAGKEIQRAQKMLLELRPLGGPEGPVAPRRVTIIVVGAARVATVAAAAAIDTAAVAGAL